MKLNHTAQYDGATFTRTSTSRRYTHCIVRVYSIAQERGLVEVKARRIWLSNLKYVQECADGKYQQPLVYRTTQSDDIWKQFVEETARLNAQALATSKARLEEGEEGAVAKELASFDERMLKIAKSNDGLSYYAGGSEWCGREDLAQRAVVAWLKRGVKAIAVPATIVEHTPKHPKGRR